MTFIKLKVLISASVATASLLLSSTPALAGLNTLNGQNGTT
jgi:hypothetical protein